MKKFGISLVLLLAVSGCIFDSRSDDNYEPLPEVRNSLGIGSVAAVYFPMIPGAVWNYDRTITNTIDGQTTTFSSIYTNQCKTKYTVDGTTYFSADDNLYTAATYWYDGNDVNFIADNLVFKVATPYEAETSSRAQKIAETVHDLERDMLYYRFNVAVGTSWPIREYHWTPDEYDIMLGSDPDEYFDIVITGTYQGKETVSTEIGTFKDCVKIQQTVSDTFRETGRDGKIFEGTATSTTHTWFAAGVGIVQEREFYTDTRGNSSFTEMELISYENISSVVSETNGHTASGKVVSWDGAGIAGTTITLQGEGNSVSVTTDENGMFSIGDLTQGYYELHPSMSGMDVAPSIASFSIIESDIYVGTFLGETATTTPALPPFSAETYLQFHEGATWTYVETSYDGEGEPRSTREVVNICNGEILHEESGERYIELDPNYGQPEYYATDGNDVYFYGPSLWMLMLVGKPALSHIRGGVEDAFDWETGEQLIYTFDKPAGTAWRITEASSTRDSSYTTVCYSGEYAGLETVKTGAGMFENCARFEKTIQIGYEAENQKGGDMFYVSGSQTVIQTRWFAPNVGMVKEVTYHYQDGDSRQEDDSYVFMPGEFMLDSELVLQSYSLP